MGLPWRSIQSNHPPIYCQSPTGRGSDVHFSRVFKIDNDGAYKRPTVRESLSNLLLYIRFGLTDADFDDEGRIVSLIVHRHIGSKFTIGSVTRDAGPMVPSKEDPGLASCCSLMFHVKRLPRLPTAASCVNDGKRTMRRCESKQE